MILLPGLAYYPPELRFLLHIATWLVTVAVALFLPFVGYAAMKQLGFQLWPLFVGWASLALFIVYAAIASMGIFTWLPVNWLPAGPARTSVVWGQSGADGEGQGGGLSTQKKKKYK